MRTRLILEEAYLRVKERKNENYTAAVNVRQLFGTVSIQMTYEGEGFDPLAADTSARNEEDTFRYTILNAYKTYIGYQSSIFSL